MVELIINVMSKITSVGSFNGKDGKKLVIFNTTDKNDPKADIFLSEAQVRIACDITKGNNMLQGSNLEVSLCKKDEVLANGKSAHLMILLYVITQSN